MQSFNHVAGGFAVAGIFASFADVNVFERYDTMAAVWIASVLPDIDHTRSIIGKVCYPLAKWLQTKFGHRTITHSIFFYLAVIIGVKAVDNLWHISFTLPVALSLGSHLIFDMCTKQGIPLMYPLSRKIFVLPANRNLRLSGTDFRSEAIVFIVFCCLNVFSYDLMAQGFWARYNQGFATYDHLQREVSRKPGDYAVMVLDVAKNDTTVALLVEQKSDELILFHEKREEFLHIETGVYKLLNFRKRKHGRHELRTVNLLQVDCDSLNTYMRLPVVKVTAQSEQEMYYFEGPIMKRGNELSVDYPNEARFAQLTIDNKETEFRIQQLDAQYKAEQTAYRLKMSELEKMREELFVRTNEKNLSDYEEGKRRERIKLLTEQINQFVPPVAVNEELYKVQHQLLEHKLRETAHLNATLLIWQAQGNRN